MTSAITRTLFGVAVALTAIGIVGSIAYAALSDALNALAVQLP